MQEKHPSALGELDALAAAASGKQMVMFLDYDGTLSPIVEDPDRAIMTDEVSDIEKQSMLCTYLLLPSTLLN
jgi:trehalose 6-phosphate phosphatase